jgi:FixJ family two-component response regulator
MGIRQTVYVVDDEPAVRQSLRWLLESVGLAVVSFGSAQELLDHEVADDGNSCLILDVRLPGMSGLELLEILEQRGIALPKLIITGHADVPMAVRAMKHGAVDFIEKPFSDQMLLERVHNALGKGAEEYRSRCAVREIQRNASGLTGREREVMELVVSGQANKQIAQRLGISQKTVEVHRARVMEKMQARGVAELVRMCVEGELCSAVPLPSLSEAAEA